MVSIGYTAWARSFQLLGIGVTCNYSYRTNASESKVAITLLPCRIQHFLIFLFFKFRHDKVRVETHHTRVVSRDLHRPGVRLSGLRPYSNGTVGVLILGLRLSLA